MPINPIDLIDESPNYDPKAKTPEQLQVEANNRLNVLQAEQAYKERNSTPEQNVTTYQREVDPATGHSKLVPVGQMTTVLTTADKKRIAEAEAFNQVQREQNRVHKPDFSDFVHLPPTARLMAIEELALPELNRLQGIFEEACDRCTELESPVSQLLEHAKHYVNSYQHSKIKLVRVNGLHHRNALHLKGELPPEGYKVLTERPVADNPHGAIVVCYKDDVKDFTDLYSDDETKAYAAQHVKFSNDRAERDRKAAAVNLAEYKKHVQAELDKVTPLNKLLKTFGVNN